MPSFPRHLRTLLIFTSIPLIVVLLFNLLVDPYASFRLLARTRFSHSAAGLFTPIAKGEMLAHHDWDVLFVGTSRVEAGLNPAHPALAGHRVYNAGISGADFNDLNLATRLAMKRGTLRHLILCPDFLCFDPAWHPTLDTKQSLLNPNLNLVEYHLSNLLGVAATRKSIDTLHFAVHQVDGLDYPLGLGAAHQGRAKKSLEIWMAGGYLRLTLPPGIERSDAWPLDQSRFDALSRLLDDAGAVGVKVDVIHLPMHAMCLEGYFAAGRWPIYERWIATLTGVIAAHNDRFPAAQVKLWDFANYDSYTTDPALNKTDWFHDPFHFTIPLGDLVLDRVLGFTPPAGEHIDDFGVLLTRENLEAHLARLRHDHAVYDEATPRIGEYHRMIRAALNARDPES